MWKAQWSATPGQTTELHVTMLFFMDGGWKYQISTSTFYTKPPALLITVAADAEKDKKSDLHDFVKLCVFPDQGLEAPTKI